VCESERPQSATQGSAIGRRLLDLDLCALLFEGSLDLVSLVARDTPP
jgi:hypothetical protein